ncbi:hypothetical protein niasHS_000344 [Heterodera schachtii]|uniref:Uncharacterized protein n=1 Tax=Heterodera schachtii TaxID=97005 RepID=A0ABD2K615_HETSC
MAVPHPKRIISTTQSACCRWANARRWLVHNQTLYLSGQIGMEPGKTELVPGGARAAAKQAMTNIEELVVFAKILLADMSDFQAVNETFKSYFTPDTYPARSLCPGGPKCRRMDAVQIDVVAIAEKRP